MKKFQSIDDLIKSTVQPGDLADYDMDMTGLIDLSPIGKASYEYDSVHEVYTVTLKLEGGEVRDYALTQEGLNDLIELGTKYFYNEMEPGYNSLSKSNE